MTVNKKSDGDTQTSKAEAHRSRSVSNSRSGIEARKESLSVESTSEYDTSLSPLLGLQQRLGNTAVQRMLQDGGELKDGIQTSLQIGSPDDRYEREAYDVTERMMRMSPPATDEYTSPDVQSGHAGGRPLPKSVRSFFEPRFGYDLRDVRVHDGSTAGEMNRRLNSLAFTYGRDVYFRPGTYAPHTRSGKRLLAHELSHVVQQTGREGGDRPASLSSTPGFRVQRLPIAGVGFFSWNFFRAKFSSTYTQYSVQERIAMIRSLLNQDWVGPLDEKALERLWGSFDKKNFFKVANEYRNLFERSWKAGAEITNLVPVQQFIAEFRQRALTEIQEVLEDSRIRLIAEQIRYGLRLATDSRGQTGMAESPTTAGLTTAAKLLAEEQRRIYELHRKQLELVQYAGIYAPFGVPGAGPMRTTITDRRKYEDLGRKLEAAEEEKKTLQAAFERQYPILATVVNNLPALERIAEGPSRDAAARLAKEIDERLKNIETVKEELKPGGDLTVWALPRILERTKKQMGIEKGSLPASIIDAQVDQVETDQALRDLGIGVVALGLGLLAAVPTGGSSLLAATAAVGVAGTATIGIMQAVESYKRYQAQAAAAQTDFDKARAIAEDPSWFWLALDIVFAVGDVIRARTLFKALRKPVARAIKKGLSKEAFEKARTKALEKAKKGGPALVRRLKQRIDRLREGSERVTGALKRHEEAVTGAGRRIDTVKPMAEFRTRLGHSVKLTPGKNLVRCSPDCAFIRSEYASELARNETLARRLFKLEEQARAIQDGDKAAANQITKNARNIVNKLEEIRRLRLPEVRLYRGLDIDALLKKIFREEEFQLAKRLFIMDKRLVVDMDYIKYVASNMIKRNAAGWERNAEAYWREIIRRYPKAFDKSNLKHMFGKEVIDKWQFLGGKRSGVPIPSLPPGGKFHSPKNNPAFRKVFPQYDVKGLRGKPLHHHHIGEGGQVAAVPEPIHAPRKPHRKWGKGKWNIGIVEKLLGVKGKEDEIAKMLEKLSKAPAVGEGIR